MLHADVGWHGREVHIPCDGPSGKERCHTVNARTKWIDWAKTIGIWLVVLGHVPGNGLTVTEFIYAFHMPLFFFISGHLAKSKSLVDTVKSGFMRLLVPYVSFYILTWIWWYLFGFLRHPEFFDQSQVFQEAVVKPFLGMLFGVGYGTSVSNIINIPLWFLVGLFNATVVFSIIDLLKSGLQKSVIIALISWLPHVLSSCGIDLLFSLDSAFMALPFYALGKYAQGATASSTVSRLMAPKSRLFYVVVAVVCFLIVGLIAAVNGRVDVNGVGYGKFPLLFYVGGLFGIMLVWGMSELFVGFFYGPTIATISRGAIVVLALHAILTGLFFALFRALHVGYDLLLSATISGIVVIMCVPIINTIESMAPILIGNRKFTST